MKRKHLIVTLFFLLLVLVFSLWSNSTDNVVRFYDHVEIGKYRFEVVIVDSPEERNKGLSGKLYLAKNEGMLFVFEKPGKYSFWMKDMNFPIDIIWIDENLNIVHMEQNILPDSYPNLLLPSREALYVLEVNAGVVKNNDFKKGDSVQIKYGKNE